MGDAAGAKTFYTDRKPYPGPSEAEEGVTYIAEDVLDATTDFLPFFDVFGTMLKLCKNDLEGNVTKLRKKLAEHTQAKTFKDLLQYELDNKLHKKSDSACIAALWYKRGLQFMLAFVEAMVASEDGSMGAVFKKAYAVTLQKYHSWIVQKALTTMAYALPAKQAMVEKLCNGDLGLESQLIEEQRAYLARVQPLVNYLHNLIIDLGLDNEEKIEEVKQ